ncbi:SusC/RagA family TonB-linked outer membrane protein [Snuella sedimenti]|uniref:SusC/RagA family TonB-linked outer membrane protein n=1 Tax=Snuella sedimenti TaxID=2798802 RepID=A0A8J7LUC6_9FLAO|nr:SusC/RagA family TonB-linked outer membrane protein [Snuella sedimenti]MBJ6369600.1 SusC/RagA family TonB-linked outer membrane protein [Snuella sedimenti]
MRTFILLFCSTVFSFTSSDIFSQSTKVIIEEDKVITIDEVFDILRTQTEFTFIYQEDLFKDAPKIHVKKGIIKANKLLKESLSKSNYNFNITKSNKIIVIEAPKEIVEVQQFSVSGTITDIDGQPLPGASVLEKGTNNGVQSDFDGKFSLKVASSDAVLVISYIGYATKEVVVNNQTNIEIILKESASELDEVVVVGYGQTSQKKLISAVSQVKTDKIEKAPFANMVEGLAGRAPGLITRQSGGDYGSIPRISIRGGGTPVVYIDDIQRDIAALAALPPGDIKNISILKDAAATAIYGFNAPSGVILVTTNTGAKEKLTFSYRNTFAIQRPTTKPTWLTAYEHSLLLNSAAFNDGLDPIISDDLLETFRTNSDPINRPNKRDVYDRAINKMALLKRHNIKLDGTAGNTSIFTSLDFFRQDGLYNGNDYGLNRYSLRSNINQKVDALNLTIKSNLSIVREEIERTPLSSWSIFSHVRNWRPGVPLFNEAGNYIGNENPLAEADQKAGVSRNRSSDIDYRLEFDFEIPQIPGLHLKAVGKYGFGNGFNKNFRTNPSGIAPLYTDDNQLRDIGKAQLSQSASEGYNYFLEGHITYLKSFKKHTVDFTGIYTVGESFGESFSASRRDFPSPQVPFLFAGSPEGRDNSGSGSESGRIGYVARLKYDFDAKYFVQVSGRYDGFDGFEDGYKYNLFPSVALGWNIDNETFAKPILDKLRISSFKLRGSWGEVGNSGARFQYLPRYNLNQNVYYSYDAFNTGFSEGNLVPTSNTTTWSKVESRNLGLDFGLFNDKLKGNLDWFYYETTGFLGSPEDTYTTTLGKSLPQINIDSEHRREGVELNLQYNTRLGNVDFYVGGNVTYFDQLWAKTDEIENDLKNPYTRQAQQIDVALRGYIDQGYYQTIEDLLNSPHREASTDTYLGDIRYQDVNGDGRVDGDDFRRLGKGDFPHIQYGINTGFAYKGLSVNVLFQGTSNRQMYIGGGGSIWNDALNHMLFTIQDDSWSPTNRDALFPRTSTFNNANGSNNQTTSSFWLQDAWYLRMKSLDITYNLKSILPKNVLPGISQWNLTLSGTNLFTISPINDYFLDPETSSTNNYGYPNGKTFSLGMNLTF